MATLYGLPRLRTYTTSWGITNQNSMSPLETPAEPLLPTKLIRDLADLVQALTRSLPRSTPWQRQLHLHLDEMDRCVEILGIAVGLNRPSPELAEAVRAVCKPARAAYTYVAMGRADMATKAAVRLVLEMARHLETEIPAGT